MFSGLWLKALGFRAFSGFSVERLALRVRGEATDLGVFTVIEDAMFMGVVVEALEQNPIKPHSEKELRTPQNPILKKN